MEFTKKSNFLPRFEKAFKIHFKKQKKKRIQKMKNCSVKEKLILLNFLKCFEK